MDKISDPYLEISIRLDIVTIMKPSVDSVFSVFGSEDIKIINVVNITDLVYVPKSDLSRCVFLYDDNLTTVTAANGLCSDRDLHH